MKWQSVQCVSTLILSILVITMWGGNEETSLFRIIIVGVLFFVILIILGIAVWASYNNNSDKKELNSIKSELEEFKKRTISAESNKIELAKLKVDYNDVKNKLQMRDYQLQIFYQFLKSQWAGKEEKCPFNEMKYDDIKKDFDKFIELLNGSDYLKKETTENN